VYVILPFVGGSLDIKLVVSTLNLIVTVVFFCFSFSDIPSPWWQACTILVGVGSALSLLVAVTAMAACCINYVVHKGSARLAGSLQLFAGESSDL